MLARRQFVTSSVDEADYTLEWCIKPFCYYSLLVVCIFGVSVCCSLSDGYQVIAGSIIDLFLLLCMLIGLLCSFIPLPVWLQENGGWLLPHLCFGGITVASQCDFLHQRMFRSGASLVHVCMCCVSNHCLFTQLSCLWDCVYVYACVCVCMCACVYVN